MLAAGRGELEAFEEIVSRYQRSAWNTAYRFLYNHEDAEDVVQDAFIRIFDAAPRYRPDASFKTFFYTILIRLCLNRIDRRKPDADLPEDIPGPEPGAAERLMESEKRRAVRSSLAALPPAQRMAVVLRYYEGMGYKEIANAMQISEKAVERLLSRGRAGMRASLPEWLKK
ncbi:MAG: RNA polymerase sigma factor [bacterium]